ncbi:MAG: hypothetical protein Q7J25_12460 [Vicinamibacterales bacterium]|nr:hypothetical protein [Vicinamibacterales bacterium]
MPDSSQVPDRAVADADSRDARIEQLLLTGLDLYFAGQYEQAINVWTRVSFLERGHGRARAYIERARGAIAERQREGDELLQLGVDAFNRGDTDHARELLTEAVERSGPDDLASSVLERVHRLRRRQLPGAVGLADAGSLPAGLVAEPPAPRTTRRVSLLTVALAAGLTGALMAGLAIEVWFAAPVEVGSPGGARAGEALLVPRASDVALARARTLAEGGHIPDALRLLDSIGALDPRRVEADRLRAELQERLLRLAGLSVPGSGEGR